MTLEVFYKCILRAQLSSAMITLVLVVRMNMHMLSNLEMQHCRESTMQAVKMQCRMHCSKVSIFVSSGVEALITIFTAIWPRIWVKNMQVLSKLCLRLGLQQAHQALYFLSSSHRTLYTGILIQVTQRVFTVQLVITLSNVLISGHGDPFLSGGRVTYSDWRWLSHILQGCTKTDSIWNQDQNWVCRVTPCCSRRPNLPPLDQSHMNVHSHQSGQQLQSIWFNSCIQPRQISQPGEMMMHHPGVNHWVRVIESTVSQPARHILLVLLWVHAHEAH